MHPYGPCGVGPAYSVHDSSPHLLVRAALPAAVFGCLVQPPGCREVLQPSVLHGSGDESLTSNVASLRLIALLQAPSTWQALLQLQTAEATSGSHAA